MIAMFTTGALLGYRYTRTHIAVLDYPIHMLEADSLSGASHSVGLNTVIEAGITCLVLLSTCSDRFPASVWLHSPNLPPTGGLNIF